MTDIGIELKPLKKLCYFSREKDPDWDADIRDDVLEECTKYGYVYHIHVDKVSNQVCITTILRWPNTVFARAFADEIQHVHKDFKNRHAINGAIILFTQHPRCLFYFFLYN